MNRPRIVPRRPPEVGPVTDGVAIEVRDLRVRLGTRPVLRDVHLDVRAGELLALVGPNGAGKSTLLAVVCGDVPASAGEVRVEGEALGRWTPARLARRRAMLPQRTSLAFPFTATEVVAMGRAPWRGRPEQEQDDEAIAEAMRLTETTALADRPFPALSGGEQGRVALARVLAQRTPILLLDEPTAALDLHHQELVLRVARERARGGAAVVAVLHDLGLAAAYADRVALLSDGRLVADGPPERVLTADRLSAAYQHDIEIISHPRTGTPLVLPIRTTEDNT
ncbi:heme ABC transporter ATP-binding protein [Micromonospora sp. NPDC050417]|uniref:heme ABC transporter ATP-binding protein n=1 Tax=Micromonospora sp. NPDC050417 TaxID=3364280 RepID=UPI0037A384AE